MSANKDLELSQGKEMVYEPRELSPAALLDAAIQRGIDAQGIAALAEMFNAMDVRRAQREFTVAMLAFQNDLPPVVKNQAVEFPTRRGGSFSSRFAPLPDIIKIAKPYLDKHGFAYTFTTKSDAKQMAVSCHVSHVGGHSQDTEFTIPIDPEPKLSVAHAAASASTFAVRYAFCLAFGIVTAMPDDDGKRGFVATQYITDEQQASLKKLAEETNSLGPDFWRFCGTTGFAEIKQKDFKRIEDALLKKKEGKK